MLHLIDPIKEYPHDFDFENVHYFRVPHFTVSENTVKWLIWTDGQKSFEYSGLFYDEANDIEYEDTYTDTKTIVKGMIELHVNPTNKDEVWLTFFTITPEYRGTKFSYEMIDTLIDVFRQNYPDKVLSCSTPSTDGRLKLYHNLTASLAMSGLKWKHSDSYSSELTNHNLEP